MKLKIMTLYESIKKKSAEAGKSINQIEIDLGFPRSSIHKWDVNIPSVAKVKAVADELHTTVDDILNGVRFGG